MQHQKELKLSQLKEEVEKEKVELSFSVFCLKHPIHRGTLSNLDPATSPSTILWCLRPLLWPLAKAFDSSRVPIIVVNNRLAVMHTLGFMQLVNID